jgi:hypothetical protein
MSMPTCRSEETSAVTVLVYCMSSLTSVAMLFGTWGRRLFAELCRDIVLHDWAAAPNDVHVARQRSRLCTLGHTVCFWTGGLCCREEDGGDGGKVELSCVWPRWDHDCVPTPLIQRAADPTGGVRRDAREKQRTRHHL